MARFDTREAEIVLSNHARRVISERGVRKGLLKEAIAKADYRFYDREQNVLVAMKRIELKGRVAGLVVIYTVTDNKAKIVTVYPSKDYVTYLQRKVNRGRWTPLHMEKGS